jgi:hypothetical protein
MSYLIGVTPAHPQVDVAGLLGIVVFLAVLLAIAFGLQIVTAPRTHRGGGVPGPSDKRLGPVV